MEDMLTATRSNAEPVAVALPVSGSKAHGGDEIAVGICMPQSRMILLKFLLQPWATPVALTAYSRMRSHPMTQPAKGPNVALVKP